ncbi:MAG: hypothetical protein AAF196_04935 [Planctomycetota bacterium]
MESERREDSWTACFAMAKWPAVFVLAWFCIGVLGELLDWNKPLGVFGDPFSRAPNQEWSIASTVNLFSFVGFWFGWRWAKRGRSPTSGTPAVVNYLLGPVLVTYLLALFTWGDTELLVFWAPMLAIPVCLGLRFWRELTRTGLLFAALVHLPIAGLAFVLHAAGAETHLSYSPRLDEVSREVALDAALARIFWWPMFTVCVLGVFGVLATAMRGSKRDARLRHV